MSKSYNVSFIFDWNRWHQEFSLFRITRDLALNTPAEGAPPNWGCIKLGYLDLSEYFGEYGYCYDCIKKLPTGRYHFRGNYWHDYNEYTGEHDDGIEYVSCMRIR